MSDDYQSIPVAEARAAVQGSGLLEAIEGPQYLSPQSPDWRPYFKPDGDAEHPDFGRVIITRQGQKPREVVIPWDEYATELELNDPDWAATRSQKPMAVFGAEVERHAYKVVFADVIAATVSPIDKVVRREIARDQTVIVAANDAMEQSMWFANVKRADAEKLNELYDGARDVGALVKVDGLQQAFTDRMLELSAAAQAPKPKPAPPTSRPQGQGNRRRNRGKR